MSPGHTTHTVVCSHVVHNILVSLPLLLQLQVSTPALGQQGLHTTHERADCVGHLDHSVIRAGVQTTIGVDTALNILSVFVFIRHLARHLVRHFWSEQTLHAAGGFLRPVRLRNMCTGEATRSYWGQSGGQEIMMIWPIFIILFKYLRYTTFILR